MKKSRLLIWIVLLGFSISVFAAAPSDFYGRGPLGVYFHHDAFHSAVCRELVASVNPEKINLTYFNYSAISFSHGDGSHIVTDDRRSSMPIPRVIHINASDADDGANFVAADHAQWVSYQTLNSLHAWLRRKTLVEARATPKQIEEVELSESHIPKEAISFLVIEDSLTRKPIGILRVVSLTLTSLSLAPFPAVLYLHQSGFLAEEDWKSALKKAYEVEPNPENPVQGTELGMLYTDKDVSSEMRKKIWQLVFNWFAQVEPIYANRESIVFGHAIGKGTKALYESRRYGKMTEVFHYELPNENGDLEFHSLLAKPVEAFIDATKDASIIRVRPSL